VPYVDLDGIAMYYEQHGAGEPVLLLHGGFCSLETMRPQLDHLSASYRVHAPERPGHGRTADRPGPITFAGMVGDTIAYLDAVGVDSAHVVGFSDGAITGLLLALQHPERLRSLVSISANLDPTVFGEDYGTEEAVGPDPTPADQVDAEREAYDRLSPDSPQHADVVLEKLGAMWRIEPQIDRADLARVTTPTLVLAGDRDSIPTHHTVDIAQAIPASQLAIVPAATHMVVRERPAAVNGLISDFLASVAR
jgi:pimeloyl-ACP methyl ester carboxylesterase